MTCATCEGKGRVPDHSGNFPDRPGVTAGPFVEMMECPDCCGHTEPVPIICPECGLVNVMPSIFASGVPISGPCPVCEYQLYFAVPDKVPE